MENIKVKVNNEAESKEVQELFFELGYAWLNTEKVYRDIGKNTYISSFKYSNRIELGMGSGAVDNKELTIPQLRDMVILKRSDIGDATHNGNYNDGINLHFYLTTDREVYMFDGCKWVLSGIRPRELKPIEKKEMKEFLVNHDNKWTLQLLDSDTEENSYRVAVPDEAIEARLNIGGSLNFTRIDGCWMNKATKGEWRGARSHDCHELVWRRSKDLTKVTNDELKHRVGVDATLADRQATYGSFEDVACVTQDLLSVLKRTGFDSLPKPHKEAFHMICSKMGRIVNGDFNHLDSWHDIGGYAKLIEDMIKKEMKNEDE